MDEKQKKGILAFIRLYPLVPEQMAAAVEQISAAALLLKAYLHRYDLPRALYPICAQLAVAQTISAGIAAGMGNSQVQSAQSVKSITEGDTTVNFASGTSEAAAVANSNAIPVSPQQVLEANREILNRYRRGAVRP